MSLINVNYGYFSTSLIDELTTLKELNIIGKATSIKYRYLSEDALTIVFSGSMSSELFEYMTGLNQLINEKAFQGLVSTVQAYTTITVFYDPKIVSNTAMPGLYCFEKIAYFLDDLFAQNYHAIAIPRPEITIPVCYDESYGLDLPWVASYHGLSIDDVIAMHTNAQYQVYMIGFVPGFAYMAGLDAKLVTPRKPTPSKSIPAGSVGIAGEQTGIYPLSTPGGWQILGRTPLTMFDSERSTPILLSAGDLVTFERIDSYTFEELKRQQHENRDH